MDNFNPVFIEDEVKVLKEDFERYGTLRRFGNVQQLEENEYIGTVLFCVQADTYTSPGNITTKLKFQFSNSDHNFGANVIFNVQSANHSVKNRMVKRKPWENNSWDLQKWSADLCTFDDAYNPEKNFIVDGELIIHMKAMVFKNPYSDGQEKACSNLPRLLWNRDDMDFVIAVGANGQPKMEIKIHKFVLASRSPVFGRMFETNMKEKTQNRLTITDFNVEVVQAAVEYFYDRDTFKALDTDNLIDLLLFADKYDIKDLKAELETHFLFHLYPDTIVKIANTSVLVNSAALKAVCIKALNLYINQNVPFDDAVTLDQEIQKELEYGAVRKVFSRPE